MTDYAALIRTIHIQYAICCKIRLSRSDFYAENINIRQNASNLRFTVVSRCVFC